MKIRTIIIAAMLATLGATGLAMAQDADDEAAPVQDAPAVQADAWGPNFVDEDEDGVCDRYQDGTQQGRMGRGNGWGRRNGMGHGRGGGPAFVDADGDGVCDRYQDGTWQGRRGRGNGWGRGQGRRASASR